MTIKDVREIIQNLKDLPAMPNVVVIALEVIKNPNSSAKQLANTIENDHAITSSILKIVNSSYFGLANQVTSIDKAITLLGFGEIKNIILSFAMKPMISTQGGKDIWEHSLKTAIASEFLAKKFGKDNPDECFALGLLHDMGKSKIPLEVLNKPGGLTEEEFGVMKTHALLGYLFSGKNGVWL